MLLFQFGWACSQISHLAAIPDLAQTPNERTMLTAIRYSVTILSTTMVYLTGTKVVITCQFNDKIFGYHFLVHGGCLIMMFYVPQEPKSGNRNFYH